MFFINNFQSNNIVKYVLAMVRALDELCTTYGPVLRLWLGSKLWICLSDPADIAVRY